MRWLGHAMRLPEDAPCQRALVEANRKVKRPQGHPISTWFEEVKKDLEKVEVEVDRSTLEKLTQDRFVWRSIIAKLYQYCNVEKGKNRRRRLE